MKILFVMGFFLPVPPLRGGAIEKGTEQLAQWLAGRGHEVTLFSRIWPGQPETEWLKGVKYRRFSGHDHSPRLLANLWQDARWNHRLRPHLAEAEAIVSHSLLLPLLFPRKAARPAILQWVGRMPKPGQARLWQRADRILAPSQSVARKISQSCPSLEPRIRQIPYPIHAQLLGAPRPKPGCGSPRRLEIGYIGRVHPEKGVDLLLAAAEKLARRSDLPEWRLTVAGPSEIADGGGGPDYLARLQARAASFSSRVQFLPAIFDSAALAEAYASLDLFVYPSLAAQGETLGVAPLEAMAAGAIPILSHLECFQDFVHAPHNGLIFDSLASDAADQLSERLEFALRQTEWREAAREAARSSAHSYDLPAIGQALERVLAEAAADTRRR